ncbi:LOW QUALITY PROTEIN: uncharacterized protein LOC134547639 [Prinia subflava]|uniref:LOW QUALITY PROTEIN: uncharacterized protein LOC134547639 n=1 Tax=Prinia subflava TaxID=208062 RepID=UPI002FE1E141
MGTVGSGRAVLTGQEAAVSVGYHDGCQHIFESERLRKAKLRVEKAIKVRGLISHCPEMPHACTCAPLAQERRARGLCWGRLSSLLSPQEKKIFALQGPYPIIRRLLRARGWVERKLPRRSRQLKQQPGGQKKQQLEKRAGGGGDKQREAVPNPRGGAQRSLGTTEPLHRPWPSNKKNKGEREDEDKKEDNKEDFEDSEDSDDIHDLMHGGLREGGTRPGSVQKGMTSFSKQEGLCQSLQNLPWFEQVDLDTFFPRCYRLGFMGEQEAFIGEPGAVALLSSSLPMSCTGPARDDTCLAEDFRLTAARSLLKLALQKVRDRPVGTEQPPKSDKGPGRLGASAQGWRRSRVSQPVPATARPRSPLHPQLVEEALQVCEQHLGVLGHQDIDRKTPSPCRTCIAWDRFLQEYYRVAHEGTRLVLSREQREQCQDVLQRLEEKLPQLGIEGNLNIWILKPSAKSRGRGIVCATRLEEVLELAQSPTGSSSRRCEWVVQKYVERPLTIFNTKFDIRQWFVVTDWKPLTAWFYRDCYLRFCSSSFSLCHLEPARHLCNVSIQKRYKRLQPDPRLPPDKIWSNTQFQAHLAQLGQADSWQRVIVPGMKAAILNALRCAREHVGSRKGSFELFGADFLIGKDFQPWLLEINSCPTMSPSSAVTRRLCANVQRDTLRLVLDRKDNPTCSIGAFELLYREAPVSSCLSVGLQLEVTGCPLKNCQLAKHRSQDKPPTTVPSAPQLPAPSGDRATKVPWSKAAREKLPPLGPQSSCCLPKSDPPALPQPPDCFAGSQELPWLLHLVRQPEEAQPLISCPMDRAPGPPTQGAPRCPLHPPGYSAGDQELPWLLHLVVRQPQEAQPQEAQPWETDLPPITGCPLDRRPVPPPQGVTRSPWQPPGGSARSQELPCLLQLVGQPEDAQPQEAQPKAALSLSNRCPLDRLSPLQVRGMPWRPPGSCAKSQGLPQLGQPRGQPEEARPQEDLPPITGCPLDRRPVPPPRGVTRSPWQPPGGSAGRPELPWLLQLVGQPEDAQDAHTQEAQPKATPSLSNRCPLGRLSPLQVHGTPWRPPGSCAKSQGLPQLGQPRGQPQAARPHRVLPPINAHPRVRGPVPQPQRAPSWPWRPSGCVPAPAGLPARPVRLPVQ